MGSVIYDFLNDNLLFDSTCIDDEFSSISEKQLKKELNNYRNHAINNLQGLGSEIRGIKSELKMFGDRDYFSTKRLMQSALYLDQIILPDPLFSLTYERSHLSNTMGQFLGFDGESKINRKTLSKAIRKMKELTPMIATDYVKFFPTSYYMEPDKDLPLNYSKTGYSDILPPEILQQYRDNVDVRTLKKTDNGLLQLKTLDVCRAISVQFKNDNNKNADVYNLLEQEIIKTNDKDRLVHFQMTLPEELPTNERFTAWVNQSINQTSIAHFERLTKGFIISNTLNATFLTGSEFTHSLLGSKNNPKIQEYTADSLMNLDLPFLEGVSMEDLMNIRTNDGEAFQLFRHELESKFKELRLETDPNILSMKIENIVHELGEVQVTKIDQKVKELRKGTLAKSVVAIGGLAGSFITSGASVAASVAALASGAHSYSEFREKVKENPAYFLWKVKNK